MNHKLLAFSIALSLPIISGCTPAQINSAIEACKGDPACYEIIDDAIKDELEARGITGGSMTNVELSEVTSFLFTFFISEENSIFTRTNFSELTTKVSIMYFSGLLSQNEYDLISQNVDSIFNDFYGPQYYRKVSDVSIFDLYSINPENKQLFLIGSGFNQQKHMIYKIGNNRFMYEVYGSESYVFTIDLSLDSLFFQSKKYISPLALYEYYAIELWKTTNFSQPHLVSTSDYLLSYRYYDTNDSYIFLREGRYYNQYKQPASAISIYPYEKNYDVYIGAMDDSVVLAINIFEGRDFSNHSVESIVIPKTQEYDYLNQSIENWMMLFESDENTTEYLNLFNKSYFFEIINKELELIKDQNFVFYTNLNF